MAEIEIYTSIDELPLDDYLVEDHDDSVLAAGPGSLIMDFPRVLSGTARPTTTYIPYTRAIKLGSVGKDVFAVKRALSHAGFGTWGY